MVDRTESGLALVLTGGGARAAYQVGCLRFLAQEAPHLNIPILSGVSAGAINAAHIASHPGSFREAILDLVELWQTLSPEEVFRTDTSALAISLLRWLSGFLSAGKWATKSSSCFMDTTPLSRFLEQHLPCDRGVLTGIQNNIDAGRLRALGITTTDYGTGQSVTWVQGRNIKPWQRPHRRSRAALLTTHHVLASSALPLLFPAVALDGGWHGDGGIRLTAPLSPAMHMGAERILAISNRYQRSQMEAETPVIGNYPPVAQILGTMMNAMFLDMLDFDASNAQRLNEFIPYLPLGHQKNLREVSTFVLRPSEDLGRTAARFESRLPTGLRFFARGLGARETESPDSLSMLMFQPDYIKRLIATGEKDARAQGDKLLRYVRGD